MKTLVMLLILSIPLTAQRKSPVVASLLEAAVPGMGYSYAGDNGKAALSMAVTVGLAILAEKQPKTKPFVAYLVFYRVFSIAGAWHTTTVIPMRDGVRLTTSIDIGALFKSDKKNRRMNITNAINKE